MRILFCFPGWVLWAWTAAVAAAAGNGTIVIENGGRVEFCFSLRQQPGGPWSQTFELEPGQRHVLETSRAVVISYWTDRARFVTLEPGGWYRIDDPRKGQLRAVTAAQKPAAARADAPRQPTGQDAAPASDEDSRFRVLRVSAIADSTYRQIVTDWRQRIRQTVAGASKYYEANFQIRLALDGTRAWEYRGLVEDVEGRIRQVLQVSPEPSELLVAFVGFGDYYKAEEQAFLTGHLGAGLPFGQHLLVTGNDDYHVNREIAVLIHELAHVFGAFHVADRRSLMQPVYEDAPIREILNDQLPMDAVSMEVIRLTRDVDFRRGVSSLDLATQQRLKQLARLNRHPTEWYKMGPVGAGHLYQHLRAQARTGSEDAGEATNAPPPDGLKVGDQVEVTAASAPVMDGGSLLAQLPRGTVLTVQRIAGDRLLVAWEPRELRGWLRADQLTARGAALTPQRAGDLWTVEEAELLDGPRLVGVLPPGVRVAVQRVVEELVLVSVQKQVLGQYQGGKILFEPVQEGWIDRQHVRARSAG
jgi:hypothetical protein